MEFISYVFLGSAIILIAGSISSILKGNISVLNTSLLGFGFLSFLDVPKYYFFVGRLRGEFPYDTYYMTVALIMMSIILFASGWWVCSKAGRAAVKSEKSKRHFRYYKAARRNGFIISVFSVLLAFAPLGAGFGVLLSFASFGVILATFVMLLNQEHYLKAAFALMVLIILLLVDPYSSRRAYIALALPVLYAVTQKMNQAKAETRGVYKVALLVCMALFFIFLNALRASHDFGVGYIEGDPVANTLNYILSLRSVDTFWNTAYIIENFPQSFKYYFGETYASIVVAPIPRGLWQDKPVGFSAILGILQATGRQYDFDPQLWASVNFFSLSPGFLGEAWANFGLWGSILLPFLLGCTAFKVSSRLSDLNLASPRVAYSSFLPFFFLVHRGDAYSAIMFPLFVFIGFSCANRFLIRAVRNHHSLGVKV